MGRLSLLVELVSPNVANKLKQAVTPTVYVPRGNYRMSTWVTLSGGTAWALQVDGIIYRVGTAGGNMIFIEHTTDFEIYSSTSKAAMQGYGYVFQAGKILQVCSSDKLILIL